MKHPVSWDTDLLFAPPQTWPADCCPAEGVSELFYAGLPWRGRPTRVYAYLGLPREASTKPVPAMVLVHGGGGTAFDEWVREWTRRGYAAIAMDTCGCTAGGEHLKRPRHEHGGPPGCGGFREMDRPVADQWMYHAVADIVLANSLLRSLPQVDPQRIGLCGISWGAILGCIVAGIDTRFVFAIPVYGCGYFLENEYAWVPQVGPDLVDLRPRWARTWDPAHWLGDVTMPTLWLTGISDFAFSLPQVQKSYRLVRGPRTLSVHKDMVHGHEPVFVQPEVYAYADHHLRGGPPMATVTGSGTADGTAWVTFRSCRPVARAELLYTLDGGPWPPRKWSSTPAQLDDSRASAVVPMGATAWQINLFDEHALVVSSEHAEASIPGSP